MGNVVVDSVEQHEVARSVGPSGELCEAAQGEPGGNLSTSVGDRSR